MFQVVTESYRGRNLKSATKQFERDLPRWRSSGYAPYSNQAVEENRGCLGVLFGTILFPKHVTLTVTYVKTSNQAPNVQPGDSVTYVGGWRMP